MSEFAKAFFETKMNQKLKDHPEKLSKLSGIYEFKVDDSSWILDLDAKTKTIRAGSETKFDCRIMISDENFRKLIEGNLNIPLALMTRKIKIEGSKMMALKLQELFA